MAIFLSVVEDGDAVAVFDHGVNRAGRKKAWHASGY
jgi:hypothetical protein